MSVRNALVTELYETIIDFLADENESLSSIKACSLVSHGFLPLARKHIFGTVQVNVPSPANGSYKIRGDPKKLVNILTRSPAIAKHVHTLKLCIQRELFDIKELPRVLKLFTRLKNLVIYEYPNPRLIPLDWAKLRLPWKEAIFHLLYLPTLTHLTLGPICGFVLSDLAHCSKLKYMSFHNVRFAPTHLEAQRFCKIYYEYEETADLSTGRNADGVLVTKLNFYHANEVALDKGLRNKVKALFAQCSQLQDIRTFKIDYDDKLVLIQGFAEMILPSLQTLQHIHIHTIVTEDYDDPLGGLPTELAAIAGKNIIETISIDMLVQTDHSCKTGDEWGALDRALTRRRSEWPKLESVSLTIEVANYSRKEGTLEDVLRKLPENQLMGLATSNDIKFSLEVTGYLV